MKSIWPLGIAMVSALGLVGVGLAQAPGTQALQLRELFLQLDSNRDGVIEKSEVPASAHASFDRLLKQGDANHDGKLEAQEYRAVLEELKEFGEQAKKKAVARFQSMDKDRDGKVSRDEFTGPKERFDLLDRNSDGQLTEQEFLGGVSAKAAGKAKAKAAAKKKVAAVKKAD
ncbi:MAG: EF-hand domain-containing protein [Isosphaeraceae bacterium]